MSDILRIATRASLLARTQSELVAGAIRAGVRGLEVELVPIRTRGDRHRGPLVEAGGKGLFTRELEDALRGGRVDLAVHSAKDLPAAMAEEFIIAAVPPRADPRDVLAARAGDLAQLPSGAAIGTGSPRRAAQLLAVRGDLRVEPIRGNVDTRLRKALGPESSLDAVVVAMAGLERLGLIESLAGSLYPLPVEQVVPAAGQGLLAVQARARDARLGDLAGPLEHPASRQALEAERSVVRQLGAGCRSCLAVHVAPTAEGWRGWAMAARPDGGDMVRVDLAGATADQVASSLVAELTARGAAALLEGS